MITFLGFLFFVVMALVGFWGLTYLIHMVLIWAAIGPLEFFEVINKGKEVEDERVTNPVGKVIYTRD